MDHTEDLKGVPIKVDYEWYIWVHIWGTQGCTHVPNKNIEKVRVKGTRKN